MADPHSLPSPDWRVRKTQHSVQTQFSSKKSSLYKPLLFAFSLAQKWVTGDRFQNQLGGYPLSKSCTSDLTHLVLNMGALVTYYSKL